MSEQTVIQVDIRIPTPLRSYTDQQPTVRVSGATVGDALNDLVTRHPDLKSQLYNEEGKLRSFVNIFRNDEDIRHLEREETALSADDELAIIPSIAGG